MIRLAVLEDVSEGSKGSKNPLPFGQVIKSCIEKSAHILGKTGGVFPFTVLQSFSLAIVLGEC